MGRSVSTPTECIVICFQDVSHLEDAQEWSDFETWVFDSCITKYPSLYRAHDVWLGSEDHVLLENDHCMIGVSKYCGLAAIWLRTKSDDLLATGYADDARLANLADNWCSSISKGFESQFKQLQRIGTFSNGESIYQSV